MSLSGSAYAPIWGPVLLIIVIFFIVAVVQWNKMKLKYYKLKYQRSSRRSQNSPKNDDSNTTVRELTREMNNSVASSATSPLLDKQMSRPPPIIVGSLTDGNEIIEEIDTKYSPPTPQAARSPAVRPPLSPSEGIGRRKDSALPKQWQRGRLLGSGSFGAVYVGIRGNGSLFAVKTITLHSDLPKERLIELKREIEVMSDLRHGNIVRYYGASIDDEGLNIFMECIHGGSLGEFVRRHKRPLDETTAIAYVRQILNGVNYLHSNDILHRDLKADNILMGSEGQLKLADFGTSKKLDLGHSRKSILSGTPLWMAPEAITNPSGVTLKADIWSVGCVTCEILNQGKPAWPTEGFDSSWQAMYMVGNWKEPLPPCTPTHPDVSLEAVDFLKTCLNPDRHKRWSAVELLSHQWLSRVIDCDEASSDSDLGGTRKISEQLQEMIKASFTMSTLGRKAEQGRKATMEEPDWLNTVSSVDSVSITLEKEVAVKPQQSSPGLIELSPPPLFTRRTSSGGSSSHISSPPIPSPLIPNNRCNHSDGLLRMGFGQPTGSPNIVTPGGIPVQPPFYNGEESVTL